MQGFDQFSLVFVEVFVGGIGFGFCFVCRVQERDERR